MHTGTMRIGWPHACAVLVLIILVACMVEHSEGRPRGMFMKRPPKSRHPLKPYKAFHLKDGGPTGIFPQPQSFTQGSTELAIHPSYFQVQTGSTSQILMKGIDRYSTSLFFPFKPAAPSSPNTLVLKIVVGSDDEELQLYVDESYNLTVSAPSSHGLGLSGTAVLSTNSIYGALRGLETFSQLIFYNSTTGTYSVPNLPIQIMDFPRFPWRGILIDISRHFLPVDTIKHLLDGMAYSKFNTLHVHISDAQSFPLVSTTYPRLTMGAWAPEAVYTHNDIKGIVQYAKERGIRVVPEFDIPGHSYSWGVGYPELVAKCPSWASDVNFWALNPVANSTFDFFYAFLTEMTTLFIDDYIHTGGDEVNVDCWFEDPSIKKWAIDHNCSTDPYRVFQYFENTLSNIISSPAKEVNVAGKMKPPIGKKVAAWQDVYDDAYGGPHMPDMVIEACRDNDLKNVIEAGYKGLYATPYYLDQQAPAGKSFYAWVDTWQAFYTADPTEGIDLTPDQLKNVLGGEACMWGEDVDETNIDSRVFPRACATAERLWSDKNVKDVGSAAGRLANFRCTSLARRGIGAGPIHQDYCPLPPRSTMKYTF